MHNLAYPRDLKDTFRACEPRRHPGQSVVPHRRNHLCRNQSELLRQGEALDERPRLKVARVGLRNAEPDLFVASHAPGRGKEYTRLAV